MSEEDINKYKKYISNFDITKYIILDNKSNYWYSAEYIDKIFKEQDKEIERLHSIIKEVREYIKDHTKEWIHDDYDVTLYYALLQNECDELLEILDKVD